MPWYEFYRREHTYLGDAEGENLQTAWEAFCAAHPDEDRNKIEALWSGRDKTPVPHEVP